MESTYNVQPITKTFLRLEFRLKHLFCCKKNLLHHLVDVIGWCQSEMLSLKLKSNTEHVQGLGANGKAAFSPKAHG